MTRDTILRALTNIEDSIEEVIGAMAESDDSEALEMLSQRLDHLDTGRILLATVLNGLTRDFGI